MTDAQPPRPQNSLGGAPAYRPSTVDAGYGPHTQQLHARYPGSQQHGFNAAPPPYAGTPQYGGAPFTDGSPHKKRNTVGIIALAVAVIGAIFACIPGALILGWALLPIGFILGVVGLFISGAPKRTAIGAVLVSIIGTIAGLMVFVTVVDDAVSDALGGADVAVSSAIGSDPVGAESTREEPAATEATVGSRGNPASIGETLSTNDWEVVVNGFTRNATGEVMAANRFNDPPPAGSQYALVNVTAKYIGDESGLADFISAAWVTESGNVIQSYDHSAVVPNPLEGELYNGAAATGNIDIAVPEADRGVLRVNIGFLDEVFVDVN